MKPLNDVIKRTSEDNALQNDWKRQCITAQNITDRFSKNMGAVLLADEVGMGKTYVALATMANYIFESKNNNQKVLLIVPPNSILLNKWEQEIASFNGKYLNNCNSKTNIMKQFRPMIVSDYWELVQNFHDYNDFEKGKVYWKTLTYFAKHIWTWVKKREILGKKSHEWHISKNISWLDINYLQFNSECSKKALWNFLDEKNEGNSSFLLKELIKKIKNGSDERSELRKLFIEFGRTQDYSEPNIFILGMTSLRKSQINTKDSKLFFTYLVGRSLHKTQRHTRKKIIKELIKKNLCAMPSGNGWAYAGNPHMKWIKKLSQIDLWGLKESVDDVLKITKNKMDLRDPYTEMGYINKLKGIQDEVIKNKLKKSGVGLSVIDEVHNWKNGKNGANEFKRYYASTIPNKLIMSATPFQLNEDELKKVFKFSTNINDGAIGIIDNLLEEKGLVSDCLEASEHFFKVWQELTIRDIKKLEDTDWSMGVNKQIKILKNNSGITEELYAFILQLEFYKKKIKLLKTQLSKVIIRHTKSRDHRHFHAGAEYKLNGRPDYKQIRRTLYEINGMGDINSSLINFMGMRVGQLVRRDIAVGNKTKFNARLLGGITSSNEACRESNKKLMLRKDITLHTKSYIDLFMNSLGKSIHPKVNATVQRAMNNYRNGLKTLIFCERLPTQMEIIRELEKKINNDVYSSKSLEVVKKERNNLLRNHESVELYWSRSFLASGHSDNGSRVLTDGLVKDVLKNINKKIVDMPGLQKSLSERQIYKLLDLELLKYFGKKNDTASSLAEILDSEYDLFSYLKINRDAYYEDIDDEVNLPDKKTINNISVNDLEKIITAESIWFTVETFEVLHKSLWELLKSEMKLLKSNGDINKSELVSLFLDIGQGLRKSLLRLDALKDVNKKGIIGVNEMLKSSLDTPEKSPWVRTVHFIESLLKADGTIRRNVHKNSKRQSLWKGVLLRDHRIKGLEQENIEATGLVKRLNGNVESDARTNICAAFNSPLLPDILVCTAIGSEGIDLHLYCDDIIHHDLPWNPAKLEQRIGRLDRVGSLSDRQYNLVGDKKSLNIGIPFLAHNYECFQYKTVLSRSQKFEVLLGKPEFSIDVEEETEDGQVIEATVDDNIKEEVISFSLPESILEYLHIDLSVCSSS